MEIPSVPQLQQQEQATNPDTSNPIAGRMLGAAAGGLLLLGAGCSNEAEPISTSPESTAIEIEADDSYISEDLPADPSELTISIEPETADVTDEDHALNDAYFTATKDAIAAGDLEAAEEAASGINIHAYQEKDRDGNGIAEAAYTETQNALNDAYFTATKDAIAAGDLEAAEEAASGINIHAYQEKDRDGNGIAEAAYTETQNALNDAKQQSA